MDLEKGDVFFTKSTKSRPNSEGITATWKGHIAGICIGHVNPKSKHPTRKEIHLIMGEIGWTTFDDVEECFDKATMDKLINFCMEKYSK